MWIQKLFEVDIKARTLAQRARRTLESQNATNIVSEAPPPNDSESEENRREQDGTFAKGVSGNPAGRPPKFVVKENKDQF